MATLTAPLLALTARGPLRPALSFRNRGRLTIAQRIPTGTRPSHHHCQTFIRLITGLTRAWEVIPNSARSTWAAAPDNLGPTRYHRYLAWNLHEARHNLRLCAIWPYAPIERTTFGSIGWYIPHPRAFLWQSNCGTTIRPWIICQRWINWPASPPYMYPINDVQPIKPIGMQRYATVRVPPSQIAVMGMAIDQSGWKYGTPANPILTIPN